jgi:nucleoside-diphosphate-sugar epimerase
MLAVTKGKVLVTGANGYIALWVVQSLLSAGYSVRGTVRKESAIAHLKETFKDHGDKFEVVVVPDITKVRFGMIPGPKPSTDKLII